MKNLIYTLFAAVVLSSCGNDKVASVDDLIAQGNLEAIRSKKSELSEQQRTLDSQLKKLDSAISTFKGNEKYIFQ